MDYQTLTRQNIKQVYELIQRDIPNFALPLEYFKMGTLEDKNFDPEMTLIKMNPNDDIPLAVFISVIIETNTRKAVLKTCLVDEKSRRKGIGSEMLEEILNRARNKRCTLISYGESLPNYWQPGVDLRHTSLLFFLKKFKFKTHRMRQNLTVWLNDYSQKPVSQHSDYTFSRIQSNEFKDTFRFVKHHFPDGTWAEEVELSFKLNPPKTFIAKDLKGEIIGWATHSQFFPGSFGPTGVLESKRGKGIGTELLKWCLWDMKEDGIENCQIMWVEDNTVKFYSKTVGAYIHHVFYPMSKKIT